MNAKADNAAAAVDMGMLGTGYMLVHRSSRPQFAPLRLMNPVTLLGRLSTNDVVLVSDNVSRRHAKMIITDLGVTLHDLDSHNGICLNGKKVRSAPVKPGDLVYVGDVCLELRRVPGAEAFPTTNTSIRAKDVSQELSEDDDSRARALASLVRVSELTAEASDDTWLPLALEVCRELVEATVACWVERGADGSLTTPVVLQPGSPRRGPVPVALPVVQKAITDRRPLLSHNVTRDAAFAGVAADALRAVMVAPVVLDGRVRGALYLARAEAGSVFTELELESLVAIGRVVALRLGSGPRPEESTTIGMDDRTGLLAAQARLVAAEEQLQAEQQEVRRLTERVHAIEADNLKLRQQHELDRQGLAKREGEREREAIAKLEQALTDAKKQTKELADVKRELERVKGDLEREQEEARLVAETAARTAAEQQAQQARAAAAEQALAQAQASIAELSQRLGTLEADKECQSADVARLREALRQESERAQGLAEAQKAQQSRVEEAGAEASALRNALRASVLPSLAEHVEAVALGTAAESSAAPRPLTVLHVALADFDTTCETASPDAVKLTLDTFCAAVSDAVVAQGGRLEQVVGHAHLATFSADASGQAAAVRAALAVAAAAPAMPVVAGVHTGPAVVGFFGGHGQGQHRSFVEAGQPVVVARAAIGFAPAARGEAPRGVVVSDVVRKAVEGTAGLAFVALGPCWVRGLQAPLPLSLVTGAAAGGAP